MTRLMLFKLLGNDVNRIGKALTEVDSIRQTFSRWLLYPWSCTRHKIQRHGSCPLEILLSRKKKKEAIHNLTHKIKSKPACSSFLVEIKNQE